MQIFRQILKSQGFVNIHSCVGKFQVGKKYLKKHEKGMFNADTKKNIQVSIKKITFFNKVETLKCIICVIHAVHFT